MIPRRDPPRGAIRPDRFLEWLLGLPWVVEHQVPDLDDSVQVHAVDCADLECRKVFAITGLLPADDSRVSVSVVVPSSTACRWQRAGWGDPVMHLPAGDMLTTFRSSLADPDLERLTMVAYRHAFRSEELQRP